MNWEKTLLFNNVIYFGYFNVFCLGRGVFATEAISTGQFVAQYAGELIKENEAKLREKDSASVFRFFFTWQGHTLW